MRDPKKLKKKIHLKSHDQFIYEIAEDNRVSLRKPTSFDIGYLRALECTLTEWKSEADEKAYKNL